MKISITDLLHLLRAHHWVKNLLVLAPPFFGGVLFSESDMFFRMVQAFFAFSFVSSAGYIVNDLFDRETDSIHPTKRFRPIASGRVGKGYALLFALLTVFISLLISLGFNKVFFVILISYFILSLAYSFYLQYIVFVDVISIAIGFVLRIEGGGFASEVKVSNWLLVMTVMLSLLLALGKRRFELERHSEDSNFRRVLSKYNPNYIDRVFAVLAVAAVLTYILYSFDRGPSEFIITIPFVCFGVIRYAYLVRTNRIGDPTESLIKDKWLFLGVLTWLIVTSLILNL